MTERPNSPLKRLAWFLGWDTTPDAHIPDAETKRNAALSDPDPLWNAGPLPGQALPSSFRTLQREGYSLYLVAPAEIAPIGQALEAWEREGHTATQLSLKWHAHDPLTIVELPHQVGFAQAFDLLGWVPFHPASQLGERDVRLYALHRESEKSFYAMVEPKSDFIIGRFRNYQAFCAHVPGIWAFPEPVVEYQDAPQRPSYNEALETWGIHELVLLETQHNTHDVALPMAQSAVPALPHASEG